MSQAPAIEERLAHVEKDVSDLKSELSRLRSTRSRIDQITGSFKRDPEFGEMGTSTDAVQLHLPADVVTVLRQRQATTIAEEEPLRVPLAIGLFAQQSMTLAKAASLAGMSRCEFAFVLKRAGLAAYEYTETEYQEDLAFMASAQES